MKLMFMTVGLLLCTSCFGGPVVIPESFQKMLDSYRSASIFSCEGNITTDKKGSPVQIKKTFTLHFERPDHFDLAVKESPSDDEPEINKIFLLHGKVYSQIAPSLKPKAEESLFAALKRCSGVSAGMSLCIPPLLLASNVFAVDTIVQKPNEPINGTNYFHFSVLNSYKQLTEVFIDPKTFLIFKLQRTFKIDPKQIPANAPSLQRMQNVEFETTISFCNINIH